MVKSFESHIAEMIYDSVLADAVARHGGVFFYARNGKREILARPRCEANIVKGNEHSNEASAIGPVTWRPGNAAGIVDYLMGSSGEPETNGVSKFSEPKRKIGRNLVALDFSPFSARVLDAATALARQSGAEHPSPSSTLPVFMENLVAGITDLIYIGIIVVFFMGSGLYVGFCEKL
ncbi:MAG: universal stress protein [Candidatus Omnitrophica bacterium]|nr:universal stress protein [Candidatus Omnitrophota bacterium]